MLYSDHEVLVCLTLESFKELQHLLGFMHNYELLIS